MNQYNTQIFKQVKTKIVSTQERKRNISPIQTNKTIKRTPSSYNKTIIPSTNKRLPKCSSTGRMPTANTGYILQKKKNLIPSKGHISNQSEIPMKHQVKNSPYQTYIRKELTMMDNHIYSGNNKYIKKTPSHSPLRPRTPDYSNNNKNTKQRNRTPDRTFGNKNIKLDFISNTNDKKGYKNNPMTTYTAKTTRTNTNSNSGSGKFKNKYQTNNTMNNHNRVASARVVSNIKKQNEKVTTQYQYKPKEQKCFTRTNCNIKKSTPPTKKVSINLNKPEPVTKVVESNQLDFSELDQFSPPYMGQTLNYNEQKKISTPLVSNYTNIELARKQHETLNVYPSGGIRQQIDDFVSRIGNKKYSTIEGSNYNNYQYDNYIKKKLNF